MATPTTMILRSLRLLGEKSIGGTLTTAEGTAYLADLNTMLEGWSLDPMMIAELTQESLALTTSVGTYIIGPGSSAWNTSMPNAIVDPCFIRDANSVDSPVEIIDDISYGNIVLKTLDGTYPRWLNYSSGTSTGTIKLWPEPSASLTLFISSWKSLQQFQALTTPLMMQPGMQRCIEYNFAIEVAGGFTKVQPEVAKIARDSMADIKRMNAPTGILGMDPGVLPRRRYGWDIRTG